MACATYATRPSAPLWFNFLRLFIDYVDSQTLSVFLPLKPSAPPHLAATLSSQYDERARATGHVHAGTGHLVHGECTWRQCFVGRRPMGQFCLVHWTSGTW